MLPSNLNDGCMLGNLPRDASPTVSTVGTVSFAGVEDVASVISDILEIIEKKQKANKGNDCWKDTTQAMKAEGKTKNDFRISLGFALIPCRN